jgi:hypothetical protein
MAIEAVALFGSHARGDAREKSDWDFLMVTAEDGRRSQDLDGCHIAVYGRAGLIADSCLGSLFVLHLVSEAKFVYDSAGFEEELKSSFSYKRSYKRTARQAADVAWYLVEYGNEFFDGQYVNRRAAWAVRTILISRSADARKPAFSVDALESLDMGSLSRSIVMERTSGEFGEFERKRLRRFLLDNGLGEPGAVSVDDFIGLFESQKNEVGLGTIKHATSVKDTVAY